MHKYWHLAHATPHARAIPECRVVPHPQACYSLKSQHRPAEAERLQQLAVALHGYVPDRLEQENMHCSNRQGISARLQLG